MIEANVIVVVPVHTRCFVFGESDLWRWWFFASSSPAPPRRPRRFSDATGDAPEFPGARAEEVEGWTDPGED